MRAPVNLPAAKVPKIQGGKRCHARGLDIMSHLLHALSGSMTNYAKRPRSGRGDVPFANLARGSLT